MINVCKNKSIICSVWNLIKLLTMKKQSVLFIQCFNIHGSESFTLCQNIPTHANTTSTPVKASTTVYLQVLICSSERTKAKAANKIPKFSKWPQWRRIHQMTLPSCVKSLWQIVTLPSRVKSLWWLVTLPSCKCQVTVTVSDTSKL